MSELESKTPPISTEADEPKISSLAVAMIVMSSPMPAYDPIPLVVMVTSVREMLVRSIVTDEPSVVDVTDPPMLSAKSAKPLIPKVSKPSVVEESTVCDANNSKPVRVDSTRDPKNSTIGGDDVDKDSENVARNSIMSPKPETESETELPDVRLTEVNVGGTESIVAEELSVVDETTAPTLPTKSL